MAMRQAMYDDHSTLEFYRRLSAKRRMLPLWHAGCFNAMIIDMRYTAKMIVRLNVQHYRPVNDTRYVVTILIPFTLHHVRLRQSGT